MASKRKQPADDLPDRIRLPRQKSNQIIDPALEEQNAKKPGSSSPAKPNPRIPTNFLSLPRELRQNILYLTYRDDILKHSRLFDFCYALCKSKSDRRYFEPLGLIAQWMRDIANMDETIAQDMMFVATQWKDKYEEFNAKYVKWHLEQGDRIKSEQENWKFGKEVLDMR